MEGEEVNSKNWIRPRRATEATAVWSKLRLCQILYVLISEMKRK